MAIPYEMLKVLLGEGSGNLSEIQAMPADKAIKYLIDNPQFMKGRLLGACLDSCRIGTMTTCYWPTDVRGLMDLIQDWREVNDYNPSFYHERKLGELYSRFELPRITHEKCPRKETHKETLTDLAGRIRCAHREVTLMKPSFIRTDPLSWDKHGQTSLRSFYEEMPCDPSSEDDETGEDLTDRIEYEKYLRLRDEFENEEPIKVLDICYAILREPENVPLSFESVLKRLNIQPETKLVYCGGHFGRDIPCRRLDELDSYEKRISESSGCNGHNDVNNAVEFCFDGWTLAFYLQKWKDQVFDGEPLWFAKNEEHWPERLHLRVTSND
ncbi:MAG: hypothetical protein ABIF88_02075 [archaeon]